MACLTISVEESFRKRLERFPWVNWSEVGRHELYKRYIFQKYLKTKKLTKDEQAFCEQIDWHPVDELPIKKEYIERIKRIQKGKNSKPMSQKQAEQWLENL